MRTFITILVTLGFHLGIAHAAEQAKPKPKPIPFGSADAPPSGGTNERTKIHFVNKRKQVVKLWWYDNGKNRHPYGELKAGESKEQGTYVGHTWLITDTFGYPLGHFVSTKHPAHAIITVE